MKLRPKGEGERRYISKVKGPLIFTSTALLMFYPVCLAEAATTSSALGLPLQTQYQTALGMPKQSLPKTSPIRLLPQGVPSTSEIDTLKSTLSNYQTQLARLKSQTPLNPANRAALDATITSVEGKIRTLTQKISDLTEAKAAYDKATSLLSQATTALSQAEATKQQALTTLTSATSNVAGAKASYDTASAKVQEAEANLATATSNEATAKAAYQVAGASVAQQTTATSTALALLNSATITAGLATTDLQQAQSAYDAAQATFNAAVSTKNEAQSAVDTARTNYNTNLIPDPTWIHPTEEVTHTRTVSYIERVATTTLVPHTTQVPVTTRVERTTLVATGGVLAEVFNRQGYNNAPPMPYQGETPIHTEIVSNINFQWGSGPVLNSGRSEDVIVRFTANLLVPEDGWYQFYTPADDGTKLNIAGMNVIDDWYDKGGGGTISDPVWIRAGIFYPFTLHYYENGGGAAVGFYTYNPQQGLSLVPATWIGSGAQQITTYEDVTTWETVTTYEEVTTYEDVTRYREETYTTIEPIQYVEKTIQVAINEGGEATFTAPEGSTFIYSNLRYEAKDRPECGINIQPNVNNLSQVTIAADNSIWGDPCGGWYKHVVGTLTYKGTPTAPLIHNPELLAILEEKEAQLNVAQASLLSASNSLDSASSSLSAASINNDVAQSDLATATSTYDLATADLTAAQQEEATAEANLNTATQELVATRTTLETHTQELATTEVTLNTATQELTEAETSHEEATNELTTQQASVASATKTLDVATTKVATSYEEVVTAPKPDTEITKAEEIITEPAPPVEEGSKEIPAELTAENLLSVDLDAVDPTELTEAQAEQLKEAALETFLTAEEGSAEYEQALDALYLAAEQDDIVLSEELAAIPGLAAATELVNFLGNAGADMSPKVREESEKVVVTAVVATGAAIQAAAGAAASAATSASAPSGGSSRKIR